MEPWVNVYNCMLKLFMYNENKQMIVHRYKRKQICYIAPIPSNGYKQIPLIAGNSG